MAERELTWREKFRRSAAITWRIIRGPTRGWRWSVVRPYWLWLIETSEQWARQ